LGRFHVSGFVAWMAWLVIHIFWLIGFRNRLLVFIQWAWAYVTFQRGTRLITGEDQFPGGNVEVVRSHGAAFLLLPWVARWPQLCSPLQPPMPSQSNGKPAATALLIHLEPVEVEMLQGVLRQFSIECETVSGDVGNTVNKKKFEACVLRLKDGAE